MVSAIHHEVDLEKKKEAQHKKHLIVEKFRHKAEMKVFGLALTALQREREWRSGLNARRLKKLFNEVRAPQSHMHRVAWIRDALVFHRFTVHCHSSLRCRAAECGAGNVLICAVFPRCSGCARRTRASSNAFFESRSARAACAASQSRGCGK